jgi:hypothetical protein
MSIIMSAGPNPGISETTAFRRVGRALRDRTAWAVNDLGMAVLALSGKVGGPRSGVVSDVAEFGDGWFEMGFRAGQRPTHSKEEIADFLERIGIEPTDDVMAKLGFKAEVTS